jgi:hypothetical protein
LKLGEYIRLDERNIMKTELCPLPKSPFSSRILDISTLILTAAVYWVTSLHNTPFQHWIDWFFHLLHQRGFIQYLIVYFTIRNLLAVLIAKTRSELPEYFFRQLFAFSFFPLLLGLAGTVTGLGATVAGFISLCHAGDIHSTKDAFSAILRGTGISLDTLYLGLGGTLWILPVYIQTLSLTRKIVQPSAAGCAPQGVASPEP